jgi:hypothetical protein
MHKNKRGISLMVSYVLLVVIAISLAAIVYPYLKSIGVPIDKAECPADLSLSIETASCNRTNNLLTITMLNRGLFNVTGAYIRFAEAGRSVRPQINSGKELYITGESSPHPLGPGQYTPGLNYPVAGLPSATQFVIEVQPAIFKKGALVPCANKIITQTVECNV